MILIIESILLVSKALWQINMFKEEKECADELEITFRDSNRTIITITDENADKWIEKITQTIENHKLYLKADCTINDISRVSELPRHIISKIINNRLRMKFPDFMNEFRIKNAKEILVDKEFQDLTFESIALKCGFGSKSNFNKKFKKFTKITPSQYKRRNVK
jgi:AraC-like DNA-binding protein